MIIQDIAFIQEVKRRFDTEVITEYKFHPKRRWRVDFYLPEFGLCIEKEGAIWAGGRHVHPSGFIADMEKYNSLTAAGLRLIRVTTDNINKAETFDLIKRCIQKPEPF